MLSAIWAWGMSWMKLRRTTSCCSGDSVTKAALTRSITWCCSASVLPLGSTEPGGPDRLVLLGGLVLLMGGATAVTVARRRADQAELITQTA